MFKDNLVLLRNMHGFSQEELAEKIGISRQAYAKWESGATVPDVEKGRRLADIYGTTLDSLLQNPTVVDTMPCPVAPRGKNIWGSVSMNDRGQVVIPKEARSQFDLSGGSRLIVLSDEEGIALVPAEKFEAKIHQIMELASRKSENNE